MNDFNGKKRSELPDEVFGIPQERKYPMPDEKHTRSAIKLFNHVEPKYEEQLAKAVIKNMKKYGIDGSVVGPNNRLRKYLPKDMIKESSIKESVSSVVSKDHKQKGYISLYSLKKIHITKSINKYKREYPVLRHVRCKDTDEYVCDGYMWFKENDLVCYVGSCQYTDDNTKWIVSLEIVPKYRGYGLSNQILDFCVKGMKCKYLSVNKNNELAKKIYDKYGFKTYHEDKTMYYMTLDNISSTNESSILPQDTGISTIVFDIGNVLVSTNFKELLMGDPEIPNEIVDTLLKLWLIDKDDIDGTIDLKTYREIVNKRMGVEFSKYIPKLFRYNIECVNAFDYTIPIIQDLKAKGYKVYYLSNWSAWTHDLLREVGKFEFLKYMDGGLFSYDAGYMKPDPEIYKLFIEKYKINPEQAVFFDDKEENVLAAKKLGFQAVQFTDHDSSIVYDYLKNNGAIYESIVQNLNEESHNNRSFNYKSIFGESGDIAMEKFIFRSKVKVDMNKTTKEIIEAIKPIIFTSKNKQQASRIGLTLKCELEFVNHNTICILVLDGSQDARNSKEARLLLSNIENDCKSKLVGYISKVTIGDGTEGCLYFTINKRYIEKSRKDLLESAVSEYGATAGTMVGTNQSDSVYIVNYMQNNAFSGYKEPRFGICRKGMKDLHVVGGKYNKFHYVHDLDKFKQEVSDIHVYRYKGKPRTKFFDIIEEMGDNDLDLYRFITGEQIMDRSDIKFDGNFIEEECFLYELDAIKSCTEASLISESEDLHAIPILNESVVGRPYNYYRDINGVFIHNEITNIRSKSYKSIEDIPESECNMVKRGYII